MAHYLMQAGCDATTCGYIAQSSDWLRKGNSQSTEKPALELSCILSFRQRKEVLRQTIFQN